MWAALFAKWFILSNIRKKIELSENNWLLVGHKNERIVRKQGQGEPVAMFWRHKASGGRLGVWRCFRIRLVVSWCPPFWPCRWLYRDGLVTCQGGKIFFLFAPAQFTTGKKGYKKYSQRGTNVPLARLLGRWYHDFGLDEVSLPRDILAGQMLVASGRFLFCFK